MERQPIKLTLLSHGGGCGCKISPVVLDKLLGGLSADAGDGKLLVGSRTKDDAAVFRLNDTRALVSTIDFFTPIVDDPGDFGRIAAANAISDVYAMGAKPLFALNVVGMPVDTLPPATIRAILQGGRRVCAEAGIPVAGGHSIDLPTPVYGLAVTGEAHPQRIKRNAGARQGDMLILSKPLGIGIFAAAVKRGLISTDAYRQMLDSTTRLNRTGEQLAMLDGVHAMTDVSGYGLCGHLMEMCEASDVSAELFLPRVPVFSQALELLAQGVSSSAAERNRDSYKQRMDFAGEVTDGDRRILFDPQTNGGLLVSCDPDDAHRVLDCFRRDGCTNAEVIGEIQDSAPCRIAVSGSIPESNG